MQFVLVRVSNLSLELCRVESCFVNCCYCANTLTNTRLEYNINRGKFENG